MEKMTPAQAQAIKKARRKGDFSSPAPEVAKDDPSNIAAKAGAAVLEVVNSSGNEEIVAAPVAERSSLFGKKVPKPDVVVDAVSETNLEKRGAPEKQLLKREFVTPAALPERTRPNPSHLTSLPGGKQEPRFMSQKEWTLVTPDNQYHLNQAAGTAEIQSAPQLAERAERAEALVSEEQDKIDGPLLFERPDEGFKETNQTSS